MSYICFGTFGEGKLGYLPIYNQHAAGNVPKLVECCYCNIDTYNHLLHLPGTNDQEVLEPLRERYIAQHYNLRKFYYECSNLKYLTGLINVPKLGHVNLSQHMRKSSDI